MGKHRLDRLQPEHLESLYRRMQANGERKAAPQLPCPPADWLYLGAMQSANAVRPGVDIKSTMGYARWLGFGTGTMAYLPDAVRALVVSKPCPVRAASQATMVPAPVGGGECRHRTPAYLERGIAMAEQRITDAREAVHATVYRTFLAVLSTHGRCGCLTDAHVARLFSAAQAKGESPRHCTDAWNNARTRLGL
ncbi:hypothetical protein SY2F82_54740 [Streptomyces sp. Y2F8-2]|nr:hypothetical protein SY2F82_54740 [Streptomyces sp. Y2F8-2]